TNDLNSDPTVPASLVTVQRSSGSSTLKSPNGLNNTLWQWTLLDIFHILLELLDLTRSQNNSILFTQLRMIRKPSQCRTRRTDPQRLNDPLQFINLIMEIGSVIYTPMSLSKWTAESRPLCIAGGEFTG
ncbi:hypothetical protein F66182_9739, partial [Fusarium sp. NRRL 66182]